MSYEIRFSRQSAKQFKKIKDDCLKERIAEAIEYIAENPLTGKPLQAELKGDRSFRAGDCRILYHFCEESKCIGIIRIEHRGKVYKSR